MANSSESVNVSKLVGHLHQVSQSNTQTESSASNGRVYLKIVDNKVSVSSDRTGRASFEQITNLFVYIMANKAISLEDRAKAIRAYAKITENFQNKTGFLYLNKLANLYVGWKADRLIAREDNKNINDFVESFKDIPEAKHYNFYSDQYDGQISENRENMQNFLSHVVTSDAKTTKKYNLKAKLTRMPLDDDQIVSLGTKFQMSGAEINHMIASTRVSYDKKLLDSGTTNKLLTGKVNNPQNESELSEKARGRCVSSDVALVVNQECEPISRNVGEPLPTFRIYTMNAPNLGGSDKLRFFSRGSQGENVFKKDAYKSEMKALLAHYLMECQQDGVEVPVIPGFGMGVFLPSDVKADGFAAFGEALNEVLKDPRFAKFSRVVMADPNSALCKAVRDKNPGMENKLAITEKSGLDVLQKGMDRGLKMGFLNPGDPRCYPGENWEGGHFALEEMLGQQTTMVLAQHPGISPNVADQTKYVGRNIR